MTADRADAVADPLPGELAWPRLGRRLLALGAGIAALGAGVLVLPGLGAVRESLEGAARMAPARRRLAVLSCASYVLVFRGVFCARMRWRTSFEIGAAELATNSLVNVGGAGGLALGA